MIGVLTHGWSGLALSFAAVQGPLLAGLAKGRAEPHQFLLSPLVAVPLTAGVGLGMAAAAPAMAAWGAAAGAWLSLLSGVAVSATAGYLGGRWMSRAPPEGAVHRRGTRVEDGLATPVASRSAGRVHFAGRDVPVADETKHFKAIGTTGTGKSTAIEGLLRSALARGDRAVIADPDGGYRARFHDAERGDVVLNPFDAASVRWDPYAEIRSPYDVEQLARSLIPDQEGAERSWRAYARTFFSAVTRQTHAAGVRDAAELYRLLVVAQADELRVLLRGTPAQPFLEEHNSRMFDSIRSVASSAVAGLEPVARQTGDGFSIRDWVEQRSHGVLFMPYTANQVAGLRSMLSAWMRLALFQAMDRDLSTGAKPAPTWFVVDELDALGPIDGLKDALARLRKFNGRCVLGFQSIAQVSSTYGAGEAHTIVENCSNSLILRCAASEGGGTARFAAQLIGDREVRRVSFSHSRRPGEWWGSQTRSEHLHLEHAVLPSQIEQLPDLVGYLKHASDPRWLRVRLTPQHAPPARGAADPGRDREALP
jgi:type IV secretory pathway TraG/TraD family ATPase VirD4